VDSKLEESMRIGRTELR